MSMQIGITGSRYGLTDAQRASLIETLDEYAYLFGADVFRHGDCLGVDAEGFQIAKDLGYRTIAHPPLDERWRAFTKSDEILLAKGYHKRNHDIVAASEFLLAFPDERKESGTWVTVRYARQVNQYRMVFDPSGKVVEHMQPPLRLE
jgi:hypothetical protein